MARRTRSGSGVGPGIRSCCVIALSVVGGERNQGNLAGALEGDRQRPLVAGAGAGDTAGEDLAALGDEPAQARDLFVVDVLGLLNAEAAYLAVRPLRLSISWRHWFLTHS